MTLRGYLDGLPSEQRSLSLLLTARAEKLAEAVPDIRDFVFLPGRSHATWVESQSVLWRAVEQLMLVSPAGAEEIPIIWIGYDVATRLSNKREAQGFLLTDRRLIAKDTVDLVFSKGAERQYPLYVGPNGIAGSASAIAAAAIEAYDWDGAGSLVDAEDAEMFSMLLVQVVAMTLETLGGVGMALAEVPVTSTDLRGRIQELGLQAQVKYADDPKHAKHFAKLAKKVPLEDGEQVLVGFTASTLVGAYGLLLTDRALRSRDLMEDAVSTPREQIDVSTVRVSPDKTHQIIVAPGEVHEVPSHLDNKEVAALLKLVKEWGESRLS